MNSIQSNNSYFFLNQNGQLDEEKKTKGFLASLNRFIQVLFGYKNYNLSSIVAKCLQNKQAVDPALLNKTFKSLHFTDAEIIILEALIEGETIELKFSSSDIDLKKFNAKLNASKELKMIFTAKKAGEAFELLRKSTHKIATFAMQTTLPLNENTPVPLSKADIYTVDKLADFYQTVNNEGSKVHLDKNDKVYISAKKAHDFRQSIMVQLQDNHADIIAYDSPTIESAGLWEYTALEKWYFAWKKSSIGHIAVEYGTKMNHRISHMMEHYENSARKLQHLLFERYALNFDALITEEAKIVIKAQLKAENNDLSDEAINALFIQTMRQLFETASEQHFQMHDNTLKQSVNPIFNQIISAIYINRGLINQDHEHKKKYKKTMLCSEYGQISLINRINEFKILLENNYALQGQSIIRLPVDKKDKDLVMPADFLRKWNPVLIKLELPTVLKDAMKS